MMFSRRHSSESQKSAGPRGHRAYVVGDIHGRLDLLDQLLAMIEADIETRPKSKNVIVFLGDLIDRGPHSAQVVERLRLYRPKFGSTVFLMGNHEEVMLRVLGGEERLLKDWFQFGGAECIRSYGLDPAGLKRMPPDQAVESLRSAIPESHIHFISKFVDTVSFGGYLFVHAGIRPGVRLPEQRQADLRWIRHPFLNDASDHGFTVVHGHTITDQVEVRPNRIGVDTGAYRSGVLTALGIERRDRWLLQTEGELNSQPKADAVQMVSKRPKVKVGG